MIELRQLTQVYGEDVVAVDRLTLAVSRNFTQRSAAARLIKSNRYNASL